MEVRRKLIGHRYSKGIHYVIYELTFKGTDTQRLGDLISCPICYVLSTRTGIQSHINGAHGRESYLHNRWCRYVSLYINGLHDPVLDPSIEEQIQSAVSTGITPPIDWYLVEIIPPATKYIFSVICKNRFIKDRLVRCNTQKDALRFIRRNINYVIEDMESFEEIVNYKFKKYVGSKDDDRLIEPPDRALKKNLSHIQRVTKEDYKKIYSIKEKPKDTILGINSKPVRLVLSEINRLSSTLCLPDGIRERSINLYHKSYLNECWSKGRIVNTIAPALIYFTSRKEKHPVTLIELEKASGISHQRIGRTYRHMCKTMKLKGYTSPTDYLPRVASVLGVSTETESKVKLLLEELIKRGYTSGKSPILCVVALIYFVSNEKVKSIDESHLGSRRSATVIAREIENIKRFIENINRRNEENVLMENYSSTLLKPTYPINITNKIKVIELEKQGDIY